MAQGTPQDITNDILDQLHALEADKSPSIFSIKLLEKEIEKLNGINYSQYYFFKGALLALQWKVDDAVSSLNNSMRLDCSQENLINVALTFHAIGLYEKAFDIYKKALDIKSFIKHVYFSNFLKCAFVLGRFDEISSYVSSRIYQCKDDEELFFLKNINKNYTSVFEVVSKKDISVFSKLMINSAVINKKRVSGLVIDFVSDGDTKVFLKVLVEHSDLKTIQDLNDTLIDLVCESPDLDLSSLPVNGCFSHSVELQKL